MTKTNKGATTMEKKLKICTYKNYGYTEVIYNDSYDYKYFKDNFIKTFNTEKQEQVRNNLAIIENIYINNYAYFDGFFDNLFYWFFHNSKNYQNARKILTSKNNIAKKFWSLGIL